MGNGSSREGKIGPLALDCHHNPAIGKVMWRSGKVTWQSTVAGTRVHDPGKPIMLLIRRGLVLWWVGFSAHPCKGCRLIVSFGEPGWDRPLRALTSEGREESERCPPPYSRGKPAPRGNRHHTSLHPTKNDDEPAEYAHLLCHGARLLWVNGGPQCRNHSGSLKPSWKEAGLLHYIPWMCSHIAHVEASCASISRQRSRS
jgi:hypothetical protein